MVIQATPKLLPQRINCDLSFVMRKDANEGAAKACLQWLAAKHQVTVRGLHYELLQKKGVDFIYLLDVMVSMAEELTKLRGHIRKLQMENDGIKGEESPHRMTR